MRILMHTNILNSILDTVKHLKPFDVRVVLSFFCFGLINNLLYVIILSAALDLVGPNVPKAVVLLADVVPSFFVKLIAPYFIEAVPYASRVIAFALLSTSGMLIIALTPTDQDSSTIAIKLIGVAFASLSSGGGELSFLGLTHHYGQKSLAAWSSGTGGAGLVGAWLYVLATGTFGLSSSATLLVCALFPLIMLGAYFAVLPRVQDRRKNGYQSIENDDEDDDIQAQASSLLQRQNSHDSHGAQSMVKKNLTRAKALIVPYMLPLCIVYVAEYSINQGVAPTLLFPLDQTPFTRFRDFYPQYNAIYQVGVFISRSSSPFIRIHQLYLPSILQLVNLILLILHALLNFIPNVYVIFVIIFWEGLLGGLVYVSTFAEIIDNVAEEDREFSLAACTVSDSGGIVIAALLGMVLEKGLCGYQVAHGRPYCRQT